MIHNNLINNKPDKIIRLPEVQLRTGLPRSTVYYYMKHNCFPDTIKLGERSVGWLESAINEWIEAKKGGLTYASK